MKNYIDLPPDLTYDQWKRRFRKARQIKKNINFILGDLALYGDDHFGEGSDYDYTQEIPADMSGETIRNAMWVCRNVPPERRREELFYSHHKEVAHLPGEAQTRWLQKAIDNGWSTRELIDEMRKFYSPPEPEPEGLTVEEMRTILESLPRTELVYQVENTRGALQDLLDHHLELCPYDEQPAVKKAVKILHNLAKLTTE